MSEAKALRRLLEAAEAIFGIDEASLLPKPILDELADAISDGRKVCPLVFGATRNPSTSGGA